MTVKGVQIDGKYVHFLSMYTFNDQALMSLDSQIVKSNHIVSASYRLTLAEQRIILSCISKIRRNEMVTDEVLYAVTAGELAELSGTDSKTAYRDLAVAAERLFERRITIFFEPDGSSRPLRKRLTRWVQDIEYIEGEGRIELRFGKTILPFLTGLTEQFTRYRLSDVAKMTSGHAIRIFELLIQYETLGRREIALEDLFNWLQLDCKYSVFANFRRRVIEPAIEQINLHSPLQVSWSQRKTGRKVTHLIFEFSPKQDSKAKKSRSNPKAITEAELSELARPGESQAQALERLGVVLKPAKARTL